MEVHGINAEDIVSSGVPSVTLKSGKA
jgi:hypothetical protein